MDLNTVRLVVEVLCFIAFLGIVAWAWSSRRTDDYRRAAAIPLDHD